MDQQTSLELGWKVGILGFAGQGDVVKSKIYEIRNLHLCKL
jgi:hypothetical protein